MGLTGQMLMKHIRFWKERKNKMKTGFGKELSTSEMIFTIKDTILKDKMVVVSSHKDFTSDTNCDEDFRAVFCGWTKVEMRRE